MARTALTVTDLVANSAVADPTYTAADAANGMKVTAAELSKIILHVKNAGGADRTVTIKAGSSNPPAWRKGLGDLAVTVTAGTNRFIGPFESARFGNAGDLNIDFDAATSTTVAAYKAPVV